MTRWRWIVAGLLLLLIGPPVAFPAAGLFHFGFGSTWQDLSRITSLAVASGTLAAAVAAATVPLGILIAILLFKTDLPGRRWLRAAIVIGLFVPLPLWATAWQSALGGGLTIFTASPGRPWPSGFAAAIAIHSLAALPWVVWIVGQGLQCVEAELEDDARLATTPWNVVWRVTLPRSRAAILAAVAWVAVQTTTEITVTDMTLVRTFAEESYTQLVLPDDSGAGMSAEAAVGRAAALAVPPMFVLAVLLVLGMHAIDRRLPSLQSAARRRPLIPLRRWRTVIAAALAAGVATLAVVPIGSLILRVGESGTPPHWELSTAWAVLNSTGRVHGTVVVASAAIAAAVGAAAATLGLTAAWLSRESHGFRNWTWIAAAVSWAAPGPVIGIGLMQTIQCLLSWEDRWGGSALSALFYTTPSMAPVFWAGLIRLWPFGLAILWQPVRSVPQHLLDAARIDGASPGRELRSIVWPLTRGAWFRAAMAIAVLVLGELSASRIVATAGGETLAHDVFTQMHYGVSATLSAQCLILLAVIVTIALIGTRRFNDR